MSNKNKQTVVQEEYTLKKDAVERLASANKKTGRKYSEEEINKYQKPFLPNVPRWVKAAFVKWWFAGAICFFFFWGLGNVIGNQLDLIFVLWIAMGICTDLLTNNVLRFFQNDKEYEPYIMLPAKKYMTFFGNIIYALPIMALVILSYQLINVAWISMAGLAADSVPFGVGPIGFGMLYTLYDFMFLAIRNRIKKA